MGAQGIRVAVAAALAGSCLAAPTAGLAQAVAPTRDELTRQQPPPPPPSTLTVSGGVERSPCPLADPQFEGIKVTLSQVEFNGLKGATPDEMRGTWADYAGREQPVAVLCEVRDRAATLLRERGYLAAVQVPTQRIENGVVRMEVLYARIVAIRARGQTGGAEDKLAGYLGKLTEDEIFDRNRAERYLLLARDLPGYNVQLTLKPAGTAPGELIGEVSVTRLAGTLEATVQNLAAQDTGRWGAQLRGQLFGLTGLGDATYASVYSTLDFKEQQIVSVGHSFRPGSEGLIVNGQFTYAWTRPDVKLNPADPDLKARTLFATIGAAYPIWRTQARNLTLGGGFDWIDQKVDFFGPLTRDHLRIAWLKADWSALDLKSRTPRYRAGASLELRQGLNILGASDDCCDAGETPPSRADGHADGTVLRANGSLEYALSRDLTVAIAPRAQIGFTSLFAFEEFTAGNYTVGRGYDPATLSGDSGVGGSLELRGPKVNPFKRSKFVVQPYVFGDAAWVWNKHVSGDPEHLKSAGGGLRGALGDRFAVDAAIAVPLERAGVDNKRGNARLWFTLTTRLLPWRS